MNRNTLMTTKGYLFSLHTLAAIIILGTIFPIEHSHAAPQAARFVSPLGIDAGDCTTAFAPCNTIGYALDQAVSGDVILIDCGTYAESLTVDKSLSFANLYFDSQCVVITGSATSRVFYVDGPVTVSFTDLVIANGFTTDSGGGVKVDDNDAAATFTRVTVRDNTADYGGGIYGFGSVTLIDSTIRDNTAQVRGGGLHNFLRAMTIQDSIIAHNTADYGAGLHNHGGNVTISNSTIRNNDARGTGGGISNHVGQVELMDSTVNDNAAVSDGGGIYNGTGDLMITASTIEGNTAESNGGGLSIDGGTLTLTESTLSSNSSDFLGGGIMSYAGVLTITQSTIDDNSTAISGGGIFNSEALTLINSTISGNTAIFGGGIHNFTSSSDVINSTIAFNTASDGEGGGIYNELSTITIRNTIVAQNQGSGNCYNEGTFLAFNVNLSSDTSCPGFSHVNQNPLLGPLQGHGGLTHAHMPDAESPTVDVGSDEVCAELGNIDQRGYWRFSVDGNGDSGDGDHCDLGAIERNAGELRQLLIPLILKQ